MRILAFGTFDPLHKGHEYFLKQAKALGILTVIVTHNDKVVLEKNRKPNEDHEKRAEKVRRLGIADRVLIGEASDKLSLIEQLNPDVIVLGYDQKIPEPLKNKVKKYKIVSLQSFKPEKYKSSLLSKKAV